MATKIFPADGLLKSKGNKPRKGAVYACGICLKKFYAAPSRRPKYCSTKCAHVGLYRSIPKQCTVCRQSYRTPVSQERYRGESKFCSKKCKGLFMSIAQIGDKNPGWKGGISRENRRLRASKKFRDWRLSVFERDDYTCQQCGERGGYLEPHHIEPFAYYPSLRFNLSNGLTLCKSCHKATGTWGQRARNIYENQALPR